MKPKSTKKHSKTKRNKLPFPKSLFVHYLQSGIPSLRERLSNLDPKQDSFGDRQNNMATREGRITTKSTTFRTATSFNVTSQETGFQFRFDIPALDDIEQQDIITWKETILNLSKTCTWNEIQLFTVLKNSISPKYWNIIKNSQTSECIFKAIFAHVFDPSTLNPLYNKLNRTVQTDFETIKDYYKEIHQIHTEIGYARGDDEEKIIVRTHESFYTNLHYITKLEMQRQGIEKAKDIFDRIQKVEEMIFEQLNHLKFHYGNYNEQNHTDRRTNDQKFCHYHMTRTHNSEECKALKRNKDQRKPKHNDKNNLIQETTHPVEPLNTTIYIRNKKVTAILDTGASGNYLSKNTAEKLGIPLKKLDPYKTVILGNGTPCQLEYEATADVQIQNCLYATFKAKFEIINSEKEIALLGMSFLHENNCKIDLKEGTFTVGRQEFEINGPEYERNFDKDLIEKTQISTIIDVKSRIDKIIKDAKTRNPSGDIRFREHEIKLKKEPKMIRRQYPVPLAIKKDSSMFLKDLETKGIITRSTSNYISPAFFIKKKNGELRLVIDYRNLNDCTINEKFPIPKIQDYLSQLQGSTYFSQIDLKSGYYQIRVKKCDQPKTAFMIANQTYLFKRMPFGLVSAPSTFQLCMMELLGHLEYVKVYLDDILIHSKTIDEHADHLENVFSILRNNTAEINFEKSSFCLEQVTYLGHIVTKDGIRPDISRIEKFKMPEITTKRQLQRLLGLINWFRPFVSNVSKKLNPLYDKLQKCNSPHLTSDDKDIVMDIISEIKRQTLLNYPVPGLKYTLYTDASEISIGAVLLQGNQTIGFYSSKLRSSEINYTTTEKETFAILKSLSFFKNLVFGEHIIVRSDNQNLFADGDVSKRLQRWKLLLSEYKIEMVFTKGKENIAADYLSRINNLETEPSQDKNSIIEEIKKRYNCINGGIILKTPEEEEEFINYSHIKLLHPGIKKHLHTIKSLVNIKNIKRKIARVNAKCRICNTSKHFKVEKIKTSGRYESNNLFEKIAIDLKGPIRSDKYQCNLSTNFFYLLVMIDAYSRYVEVAVLKRIRSKDIINAIKKHWLDKHPSPKELLSDQGRQFISQEFLEFRTNHHIKHRFTTPYNPQCNGIVERTNKTIGEILRIMIGRSIEELKNAISVRCNQTWHSSIGKSPQELLKSKNRKTENNAKLPEQSHAEITKFEVGKKIYLRNYSPEKTEPLWFGPFKILEIGPNTNYLKIQTKNGTKIVSSKNVRREAECDDPADLDHPKNKIKNFINPGGK